MRRSALALLAALAWGGCGQAQTPPPADPAPAIDNVSDMEAMTVPVMVNDQGPFRFAIDSGSTQTLIASEIAERLHLPPKGQVRVHAMSGVTSLRTVAIERIQISENIRYDIRVAAVPRANLRADGLLGINLLKNQRVTLDFTAKTVRIAPSAVAEARKDEVRRSVDEIVVTARLQKGQLIMTDADADGQPVRVIVDSGSQSSVGNLRLMELLVKNVPGARIQPINLIDVIGRSTAAQYTHVERLRLGGMSLSPIAIAFADVHPFRLFGLMKKPALLLGMETLQNFSRVEIDFAARKVSFQMPKGKMGRE